MNSNCTIIHINRLNLSDNLCLRYTYHVRSTIYIFKSLMSLLGLICLTCSLAVATGHVPFCPFLLPFPSPYLLKVPSWIVSTCCLLLSCVPTWPLSGPTWPALLAYVLSSPLSFSEDEGKKGQHDSPTLIPPSARQQQ